MSRARLGTSRLELGTSEGYLNLGEGWLSAETLEDGTPFVWAHGEASSFEIDLVEAKNLILKARGWPYRGPDEVAQRIRVEVNGEEAAEFRMPPGLKTTEVKIPRRFLRPGLNDVTLRPKVKRQDESPHISAAWESFEIAEASTAAPRFEGETLLVPGSKAIEFYLDFDGEAVLAFDRLVGPSSARLQVRLESDGSEPFEALLGGQETPGGLDLGERRGLHRLTLAALDPKSRGLAVEIVSPRVTGVVARGTPPAEDWMSQVERVALAGDVTRRPNVILYLIDTLRADRLGAYGYRPETGPVSPRIDAFADDGVLFEETSAQSSWTRASMSTIMTGYRPSRHGVETRRDALPKEALTLAELLSASGYRTAGVITNGNAGEAFGMAQGFDSFELLQGDGHGLPAGVEKVNERAESWLDDFEKDRSEPFFLYLHTMEPHAPYIIEERLPGDLQEQELEKEVLEELERRGVPTDGPKEYGSVLWIQALFHRLLPADAGTGEEVGHAYDASIRHNDRYFGILLDSLSARGLLEDTVIVLLSDHGEELFDHGSWSHGITLYEEQLHVPFIMRFPGEGAPRGVRTKRRARQVDLLPTLLDYLSLPAPPDLDGTSLLASAGEPTFGFADLDLDGRRATSWIESPFKLICDLRSSCRLYDLEHDPREISDLAATLPIRTSYLRSQLEGARARAKALAAEEVELDPELERQLEALGYI